MEGLEQTAAESISIEIRSLHSLVADLGKTQLSMKREMTDGMNDIRTAFQSLRDLLIGWSGENPPNCSEEKNEDVVEVFNISSDSSSLETMSKNKPKHTATRRKEKAVKKSPTRLGSPIWTRQAKERRDGKKQVVGPFITTKALSTLDRLLINHVFDPSKNASEEFVKSPWFHLNREEVNALQPKKPLSTKVITMCVDLLTVPEMKKETRVNWFLPPAFAVYCTTGDRVFAVSEKTMKTVYCSDDFNSCEKIFVPVLVDNHLFLCVFDLKIEVTEIWDSLPNCLHPLRREEKVLELAKKLDSIFLESVFRRFKCNMLCSFTIREVVNAPRQKNGCGYSLSFSCLAWFIISCLMRCGGHLDDCARGMRKKFDSEEERLDLALYLLNHEKNLVRDDLHHKVLMECVRRGNSAEGGLEISGTPE